MRPGWPHWSRSRSRIACHRNCGVAVDHRIDSPRDNNPLSFLPRLETVPRQYFVLQSGEERLGRRVVETRSSPAHRLPNVELAAERGEVVGGVGGAAVEVEDHPRDPVLPTADSDGHLDGLSSQVGIGAAAGGVAEQPAGEQVDRCGGRACPRRWGFRSYRRPRSRSAQAR
jgi:hypothetical protein